MQANPNKKTWKDVFQTTFNMSVSDFYTKVSGYTPSMHTVLPSTSLTLESIFSYVPEDGAVVDAKWKLATTWSVLKMH